MRVIAAGAGRPLILLHPFPLNAEYWSAQLANVPDGWRLIAPDFRGFGRDGHAGTPAQSMDDYARDVIALLDAEGADRAAIAGVSMGGYVAFAMLRLAADRIAALVLANTRMDADPPGTRAAREEMLALVAREGSAGVARTMPKLLGATSARERPALVARLRDWIEAAPAEGIAAAVRAMMARPDSTATAQAIAVPTLIISGDEDALTPPPLQHAMHAAIPGSRHEVLAGAGHLASFEAPGAFDALLRRFLHDL